MLPNKGKEAFFLFFWVFLNLRYVLAEQSLCEVICHCQHFEWNNTGKEMSTNPTWWYVVSTNCFKDMRDFSKHRLYMRWFVYNI